jgi:hypothetical protein
MDIEFSPKPGKKKKGTPAEPVPSFIDTHAAQSPGNFAEKTDLELKQAELVNEEPDRSEENSPDTISPQKNGILYQLFSPETRLGRFMRPALRNTGALVAAFTVGLLLAYFLLYRPAAVERDKIKAEFAATSQELSTSQEQLASLQTRYDQTSAELEAANRRANYQQLVGNVSRARLALAEKDGPSALVVLKEVQTNLKKLEPAIIKVDANMAKILSTRLELVMTELNRDPVTAVSDLEKLYSSLLELEKALQQ